MRSLISSYGLVENVSKGQLRVTKTAEDIFHGYPEDVKLAALHTAANCPGLYNEIYERFEGAVPGDNAVRSFLVQRGFTNEGVEKALRAFLETNRYLEIAGASESYRVAPQSAPESPPAQQREEEPRSMETPTAYQTQGSGKSLTFFRQGPLDFSLTSTGLALTGNTNSASELKKFIERLKALAAVLPDSLSEEANGEAGCLRGRYRRVSINNKAYASHRIAWLIHYGSIPTEIDHINGKRDDNRIANLRDVTCSENRKNHARAANNTSGFVGVVWCRDRWHARIKVNRKPIHLGCFKTIEEAVHARKVAEAAYGFHKNHGREPL